MNNMILRVSFLSGTKIGDAIQEAIDKANTFNCAGISFTHRGINMYVTQTSQVNTELDYYYEMLECVL